MRMARLRGALGEHDRFGLPGLHRLACIRIARDDWPGVAGPEIRMAWFGLRSAVFVSGPVDKVQATGGGIRRPPVCGHGEQFLP